MTETETVKHSNGKRRADKQKMYSWQKMHSQECIKCENETLKPNPNPNHKLASIHCGPYSNPSPNPTHPNPNPLP